MLKRDKHKLPPTAENIQTSISAYTTIPIVSSLILAFATASIPACSSSNNVTNNIVSAVYACCVACALCSLAGSILTIYQTSKVLADLGPERAAQYLKDTYTFRSVSRLTTYAGVLFFVLGYTVCSAGTSDSAAVATFISFILSAAMLSSAYVFKRMKRIYDDQYHTTTAPSE